MPDLTLHHLQVGQGERIIWLLEELSLPYTLTLYQRDPILSPPSLKALHPIGASPVLEDATFTPDAPLLLAESGAIAEYLVHKHGNGRLALPPSHPNYADYLYWFHFANATLQPSVVRRLTIRTTLPDPTPDAPQIKAVNQRLDNTLRYFDKRVTENTWLAGADFTIADIMTLMTFTAMRKFEPFDLSDYPGILAWLRRCTDRPAYRTALSKGDPELDIEDLITASGPSRFVPAVKK